MRKFSILIISGFFVLGISRATEAMMHNEEMQLTQAQSPKDTTQEKEAIDVGNKICPVSGEKIDQNLKATYEYEGKTYNFCCTACIEEFKKDPEKYIKKIEEELQTESKEKVKEEKHEMHHHHH